MSSSGCWATGVGSIPLIHGFQPYGAGALLEPSTLYQTRLLIDADTANEIEDHHALASALPSPERMTVEAVTAKPFLFAHHRSHLLDLEKARLADEPLVGGFQG